MAKTKVLFIDEADAITPYEERKQLQRDRKRIKQERDIDRRQKRADKRRQAY